MFKRILLEVIKKNQKDGFITVIYGPRRVGKTVLLEQLIASYGNIKSITFNGDTEETRNLLSSTSEVRLSNAVNQYDLIAVDEAQRINNIGLSLKIIIDKFPKKKIFVTGSSSIDIAQGLKESLTGRTIKYKLYPLSTHELTAGIDDYQKAAILQDQLIYGGYPYLLQLTKEEDKQAYLESVVDDYLFLDILQLKDIGQPDVLKRLATLLAFQVGSQVSLNELSVSLGIDVKTVGRYISLLKQGFIIFELGAYSTNIRKEVSKSKKYYFWDLGIRNAITRQYFDLGFRADTGSLWENFLAVERLKKQEYSLKTINNYFWRSYEKAEIDWIEIDNKKQISAYEFKYSQKGVKTPQAFFEAYKVKVREISKENYLDFV